MRSFIAKVSCALLLFSAGCDLGDPVAHRAVVLEFPASGQQTNASISSSDPEVSEALHLIDGVFVAQGFVRNTNSPIAQEKALGVVVAYGPHDVSIKDRELTVNFFESGHRHSSAKVIDASSSLAEALGKRFGVNRVRVESER